ncbi:MAG: heavy metal translocating P-type ATPase [Acidobacteriota bacterium]
MAPGPQLVPSCPVCEIHAESVFRVDGLDCHEEVAILNRRLKDLPGLERFSADVVGGRIRVTYDAAQLSATSIADAVADTGMRAWLQQEEAARVADPTRRTKQTLLGVSGAALVAGMAAGAFEDLIVASALLHGVAVLAGGWYWARRAWSAARLYALDINALMLLAVAGALAIGEWAEAATVTFLFALAQWLESRNLERARLAIRALMDLSPADALVRREGQEQRIPVDEVLQNDLVVVRPGEKIPLDGVVTAGHSAVNQAPITGESMPADKGPGSEVFAGTINGHGALEFRVTHLRRETTLARIIDLVERAQAQRAPSQTFVERFARVYTPVVVVLAVVLAAVPPLAFDEAFGTWFYRALVLLVISCPCALVISTPVSIVSALAGAARKGILVKGGIHLETLARVDCVAFDKTGTLTHGVPDVVDVIPIGRHPAGEVLRIAAALEGRSDHPVGRAILRRAAHHGIEVEPGERHQALPGLGVFAVVEGAAALAGNHRLFEERGLCSADVERVLEGVAARGHAPVLVARDGRTIGVVALADTPRDAAAGAIDLLRRHGVRHVVMLTGDNGDTARRMAGDLGIAEIRAGLLPDDKVSAVLGLKRDYGTVVMVGDGVNDAPALAAASVGIAMGVAGSDAALETADVALMADELLRIPFAIRLSRATLRNIRTNITVALGLKAVFLVLAALGLATLWMAVVADMGASLLVIANGLRLLRFD